MTVEPTHMVFTTGRFYDPANRHGVTLCGLKTDPRTGPRLRTVGSHAAYWPARLARPDFELCTHCEHVYDRMPDTDDVETYVPPVEMPGQLDAQGVLDFGGVA